MQRVSTLAITTLTLILLAGNGTAIYAQSSMQGGQQGMQQGGQQGMQQGGQQGRDLRPDDARKETTPQA